MNVIVLAAGKGSRMRSERAKVLHAIGGQPMLWHVLKAAEQAGGTRLICVVGHQADAVKAAVERFEGLSQPVVFAHQEPPMGTGHAVLCALGLLDESPLTLVLYGDVPLIQAQTLRSMHALADAHAPGLCLLTATLADPHGYGRILRDPGGRVLGCIEEKDATQDQRTITEVNTGILLAPTRDLARWVRQIDNQNAQGEYYLTDVLAMAVGEGKEIATMTCKDESEILGVNSQSQRAELERRHQQALALDLMDRGTALADPARIDIRGHLTCAEGVEIDVGCVFEGDVWLGEGVVIGPNCVLKNSRVEAGARIEAMSHLDGCIVGPRAVVGPFARLRPGTELLEASHVGNFSEVKNSRIGPYSKANHLSYIGDATVGARVNIGAGTITCNYDGAEKHRTVIEDDVFIGSDTQLVAPVTVHEGATLGAGTTLTADAPAQQLTLSRARQTSIARWKRPKKQAH